MFDPAPIADEIAGWTSMGVKLPKALDAAVQTFEAVRWIEVGHGFNLDTATITADNAEATIEALAQHIVFGENNPGRLSPKAEAKRRIVNMAALQVIREGKAAVSDIIEKLTPVLDRHVAAYKAAVDKLPYSGMDLGYGLVSKPTIDQLDFETLMEAGSEAVEAYADAKREAASLQRISYWARAAAQLPGQSGQSDPVLSILQPTQKELVSLEKELARKETLNNKVLNALDLVFLAAVELGVDFGINTGDEMEEMRDNASPRFVYS